MSGQVLVAHMKRLFDAADVNGDGVLHRDEFVKVKRVTSLVAVPDSARPAPLSTV